MQWPSDLPIASLRRLARGLLYDRHRAEDVVQEAWLVALRRRPSPEGLRGWLSEAVRRIARSAGRDEVRRAVREERAARPEALPSALDTAAQIEILRALLDAVGTLDEPYRSAIVLRYFDELPPREIARRLGMPVNTARTHVRRGLERLRRQLDGERGRGRQELLAALAPFAGKMPWTAALGFPAEPWVASNWSAALVVKNKVALALAAALVLGISLVGFRWLSDSGERTTAIASSIAAPPPASTGSQLERELPARLTNPESSRRVPGSSTDPLSKATWVVRGHALRDGESAPGLSLAGRVYSGTGAEGVPLVEERFRADQAGDFSWAIEPPADLVTVLIESVDGYFPPSFQQEVFVPGDPPPERWIVGAYTLDCTVRGTVRDSTGRPIASARIGESLSGLKTTSDETGRYALRIPSDLSSSVFEPEVKLKAIASGFALKSFTVSISSGEVQSPDVFLERELRLRGHVVDEDGVTIAGVLVHPEYLYDLNSTTTDEKGSFELGGLSSDAKSLAIEASKAGFLQSNREVTPEEAQFEIEIILVRGVKVNGRIVSPGGAAVWGALISASDTSGRMNAQAYSDRDGCFVLDPVPAGVQKFSVKRRRLAQKDQKVRIPKGIDRFEIELQLEEGHFIGGLLLDDKGEPVPWMTIDADEDADSLFADHYGFSNTGADGRFLIEGLPDRAIRLQIWDGELPQEERVYALDRDDLVLRLKPSASVAGRIIDEETGEPIRSFTVHFEFHPTGSFEGWRFQIDRSFTSSDGTWHWELSLEPGEEVTVKGEAPGYAPSDALVVRAAVDPDPSDFVIPMKKGTSVRGVVVERENGAPVEGARVRRFIDRLDRTDGTVFEATTDSVGRFELVDVPAGEMSLAVEHPGWSLAVDGPFELAGPAPTERRIEVVKGGAIRGRLLDANGHVLAGETVLLECEEGTEEAREWETACDSGGCWAFAMLTPGRYRVSWTRRLGEATIQDLRRDLEVRGGETIELVLQPKGQATLHGMIEFDGELPDVVEVSLSPEPGSTDPAAPTPPRMGRAAFAEHGRFLVEHLAPGTYMVWVVCDLEPDLGPFGPCATGEARVVVQESGSTEVVVHAEREDP